MCSSWRDSFKHFLDDVGERPSRSHTLDRIDVNGDYEPSNCRWSTRALQSYNQNIQRNNSSGYRGVTLHRPTGLWLSRLNFDRVAYFLGYYGNPEQAALAYDAAAIQILGSNAYSNLLVN